MAAPPRPSPASAPARARAARDPAQRLGLHGDWDWALHLPLHYLDQTRITPVAALREGHPALVQARVVRAELGGGRRQLRVVVDDDSGPLELRFFHFYPNWQRQYAVGKWLRIQGEPRAALFGMEMVHPSCHVARPEQPLPDALTPIYPSAAGISQAWLRAQTSAALARLELAELLPQSLLRRLQLPAIGDALRLLHAPPPGIDQQALLERSHPAWQRLQFDELLAQQLAQQLARARRQARAAWPLPAAAGSSLTHSLLQALPFTLTADQQACVAQIAADLERGTPMHRLLQGDVGSGKTVVAALAAAQCIGAGLQCALMAPTDILAGQHLRKLADWLQPLGIEVVWLSGSQTRREREQALARIASGDAQLVVGTHAVIEDKVAFARLGLAIVDEQHRFGVAQRLSLRGKGAADRDAGPREPHLLMMSATPIPRTLAMALFGDLDVSTIAERPPGRSPVRTRVFADARRDAVLERVQAMVDAGRQVYWVCPLVDDSEATPDRPALDLRNVEATCAELQQRMGVERVGLLHGRLPAARKAEVMGAFASGALRLLVATTVIEVGVDVPAATLIVIEHAERFGLSQLHQLRGRVGRGADAAECLLLFTPPLSATASERLQALRDSQDGFVLAQKDLELRGPGELLGARQSGLQALRYADLGRDAALLERARDSALWLLQHDPDAARRHLERWLGGGQDWLAA